MRKFYPADDPKKKSVPLSDWPLRKKKAGDKSRQKSGQTSRVKAFLRRMGL